VTIIRSLTLGLVCGALLTFAAGAAAAPAPRDALLMARSHAHVLAKQGTTSEVRKTAAAALKALSLATFPELWINARQADAPAYGTRVFTESAAALRALQRLKGSSAAMALIVGADHDLAEGVIREAHGGRRALLRAAKLQLAAGSRDVATRRLGAAVGSFSRSWLSAYDALTELVATGATTVRSSAVAAAAENALGSSQIGLAGPMFPQGAPPLSADGKPEIFFAGSEACPFCGVERWGMIVALSQFGTFSHLQLMQSLPTERPKDRTFTFFGSRYHSPYVTFDPVEVWSNVRRGVSFKHLQPLSAAQNALLQQFDPPAQTPFIDIANRFININSTVPPGLIAGMSWTEILSALRNPASAPAQAIGGEAEVLTAEVCEATSGNPQSVCSSAVVQQYEAALPLLNGKGGGCPAPQASDSARAVEAGSRRRAAQDRSRRRAAQDRSRRLAAQDRSRRRAGPVAVVAKCHV
jgi:Domain of unknown function (DUF929)